MIMSSLTVNLLTALMRKLTTNNPSGAGEREILKLKSGVDIILTAEVIPLLLTPEFGITSTKTVEDTMLTARASIGVLTTRNRTNSLTYCDSPHLGL